MNLEKRLEELRADYEKARDVISSIKERFEEAKNNLSQIIGRLQEVTHLKEQKGDVDNGTSNK